MKLKLSGDYDWIFLRNTLVDTFEKCGSKEDFLKVIDALIQGIGSVDMIQAQRKRLGLKPLSKKELEGLKKDG